MRRSRPNKQKSRGSFNGRAAQTHKLNLSAPLRGGWRL